MMDINPDRKYTKFIEVPDKSGFEMFYNIKMDRLGFEGYLKFRMQSCFVLGLTVNILEYLILNLLLQS